MECWKDGNNMEGWRCGEKLGEAVRIYRGGMRRFKVKRGSRCGGRKRASGD